MPRAKKTAMGAPAQKIEAITGQTYGDAKQQEMLQKAMPAPNQMAAPSPTRPQTSPQQQQPQEVSQAPTARPRLSLAEAMQRISGSGGLLTAPDDNPDLPVTDGLPSGPGRGPEALTYGSTLGNTLRMLANQTGDPIFTELASRARF